MLMDFYRDHVSQITDSPGPTLTAAPALQTIGWIAAAGFRRPKSSLFGSEQTQLTHNHSVMFRHDGQCRPVAAMGSRERRFRRPAA